MSIVNINGINKAELLAKLYNNSKPLGMEIVHYALENMTISEAEELLESQTYFDYLRGRVMKIELKNDELSTFLYNRDNGYDACERIVESLKKESNV